MANDEGDKDRGAPDAILYHDSMKVGKSMGGRLANVQERFGPILAGPDAKYKGFRSHPIYNRPVGGGFNLATFSADLDATSLLYPTTHPTKPKRPRYEWVDQPDGSRHGWLLPDDDDDEAPAPKAIRRSKDVPTPPEGTADAR